MALTKISFEIEVEGTFQNGNTLDKTRIYELLAQVAEEEYDRQFEENKIVRRFNFTMKNDDIDDTLELSNEEATEVEPTEQQPRARRKKAASFEVPSARLFLPTGHGLGQR